MSGFVLHPEDLADLEEVWEYIAADNLEAADRVLDEIRLALQSLASFPQMGHTRADLTTRPLRFHSVRDHLIAYVPGRWPGDGEGCR
jgi:toxin ParE1/3/4